MRTTVDLNETLIRQAFAATGLRTKTALLEEGLRAVSSRMKRQLVEI